MDSFFLGVDGGKSSTTALIGDGSGSVIGYGNGGPSNHVEEIEAGRIRFINAINECVRRACEDAALDASAVRFESACLGFSGGPLDKEPILREILNCDRIQVTHDALIALAGSTGGVPGVVVISGTGSIAFGRNESGTTARAGGWGYIFGDEGSGFDITRQALRAALSFEEGWGTPTVLRDILLEEAHAGDANDVLHRFYTSDFPRSRIAGFSRAVDRAAAGGDRVAVRILENAAQHLATFAGAVRNQLFAPGDGALISYIGGVFRSTRVLERFRGLVELTDGNQVAAPLYGPAAGALLEAYRRAGIRVSLSRVPEIEKA